MLNGIRSKRESLNNFSLSIFSPPYKVLPQLSLPATRIFTKFDKNTPMMLCIQSADIRSTKIYRFQAGEEYRSAACTTKFPKPFPNISAFDISDNTDNQVEVVAIANSAEVNLKQCRICLENEDPAKMISPCVCNGSQKYVHEACLKIWLLKSEKDESELTCGEVCRGKFNMVFYYARGLSFCTEKAHKCWIPFVMVCVIIMMIVLMNDVGKLERELSTAAIISIYSVLGFLGLAGLMVCVCNIRNICSDNTVTSWNILNYDSTG